MVLLASRARRGRSRRWPGTGTSSRLETAGDVRHGAAEARRRVEEQRFGHVGPGDRAVVVVGDREGARRAGSRTAGPSRRTTTCARAPLAERGVERAAVGAAGRSPRCAVAKPSILPLSISTCVPSHSWSVSSEQRCGACAHGTVPPSGVGVAPRRRARSRRRRAGPVPYCVQVAEVAVERVVFHHHDDDVVDRDVGADRRARAERLGGQGAARELARGAIGLRRGVVDAGGVDAAVRGAAGARARAPAAEGRARDASKGSTMERRRMRSLDPSVISRRAQRRRTPLRQMRAPSTRAATGAERALGACRVASLTDTAAAMVRLASVTTPGLARFACPPSGSPTRRRGSPGRATPTSGRRTSRPRAPRSRSSSPPSPTGRRAEVLVPDEEQEAPRARRAPRAGRALPPRPLRRHLAARHGAALPRAARGGERRRRCASASTAGAASTCSSTTTAVAERIAAHRGAAARFACPSCSRAARSRSTARAPC